MAGVIVCGLFVPVGGGVIIDPGEPAAPTGTVATEPAVAAPVGPTGVVGDPLVGFDVAGCSVSDEQPATNDVNANKDKAN